MTTTRFRSIAVLSILAAAAIAAVGALRLVGGGKPAESADDPLARIERRLAALEDRVKELGRSAAANHPAKAPAAGGTRRSPPPLVPALPGPAPDAAPAAAAPVPDAAPAATPAAPKPGDRAATLAAELRRLGERMRELERREDERLPGIDPNLPPEELARRAALALEDGRSERARLYFQQLLERFPLHPEAPFALYMLGYQDMETGSPATAIERFARIVNDFPTNDHVPYARFYLGVIAVEKKDWPTAARELATAAEGLPADPAYRASALVNLAVAQLGAGRAADARGLWERVVADFGDEPESAAAVTRARRYLSHPPTLR